MNEGQPLLQAPWILASIKCRVQTCKATLDPDYAKTVNGLCSTHRHGKTPR